VPRYTYRRLAKLPSTADQLRRQTVLNLPGMLNGLSFEHTVMEPGAAVPISTEDEIGLLIFTIAGRGVMAAKLRGRGQRSFRVVEWRMFLSANRYPP